MAETITREEFARRLIESGLLSEVDPSAVLDDSVPGAVSSDARAFARGLVDSGRLTTFQAEALLDGRGSQLLIGNYVILGRLGAGGMGTVYKARHRSMKRVVALKMLSKDNSGTSDYPQRFRREVETIAQLSHPNIVTAHDAGETETSLYLVMEYVDGRDLAAEVARNGPLSTAGAADCVLQAARGLAYAHDHGIVHRDVKPANLLRSHAGVVKVTDLGLAHLANALLTGENTSLTQAGDILGTADYIAPEQSLDSAAVDHRVDLYSLGGTLFFLLTGRPMYTARTLVALLLKHRFDPIPSLTDVRPDVPAELDEIYRRMAAKNPEDRYSSMSEAVRALERIEGHAALSDVRPGEGGPSRPTVSPTNVTMAGDPSLTVGSIDFDLSVPLSGETTAPTSSEVRRVSDLTVVLVEPSRFQARITRDYLQQLRIENVVTVDSGRQALELTKREGAIVVLSSMNLSDMTGVQLAQALLDDPDCANIGFLLCSNDDAAGGAIRALDAPRLVMLPKPLDLKRLAQALAQATGRVVEEIFG